MNIQINHGVATRYYITDAGRSLAAVGAPCHVVVVPRLGIEALAEHLSWLVRPRPAPGGIFSRLLARPAPSPSPEALREQAKLKLFADFKEIVSGRSGFSFGYELPTVFLSREIERHALMVTTVLKLRGMGLMLGVAVPGETPSFDGLAGQIHESCRDHLLPEAAARQLWIYRFDAGLSVVAGLRQTVLATGQTTEEVIAAHPDLVSPPMPPEPSAG